MSRYLKKKNNEKYTAIHQSGRTQDSPSSLRELAGGRGETKAAAWPKPTTSIFEAAKQAKNPRMISKQREPEGCGADPQIIEIVDPISPRLEPRRWGKFKADGMSAYSSIVSQIRAGYRVLFTFIQKIPLTMYLDSLVLSYEKKKEEKKTEEIWKQKYAPLEF